MRSEKSTQRFVEQLPLHPLLSCMRFHDVTNPQGVAERRVGIKERHSLQVLSLCERKILAHLLILSCISEGHNCRQGSISCRLALRAQRQAGSIVRQSCGTWLIVCIMA